MRASTRTSSVPARGAGSPALARRRRPTARPARSRRAPASPPAGRRRPCCLRCAGRRATPARRRGCAARRIPAPARGPPGCASTSVIAIGGSAGGVSNASGGDTATLPARSVAVIVDRRRARRRQRRQRHRRRRSVVCPHAERARHLDAARLRSRRVAVAGSSVAKLTRERTGPRRRSTASGEHRRARRRPPPPTSKMPTTPPPRSAPPAAVVPAPITTWQAHRARQRGRQRRRDSRRRRRTARRSAHRGDGPAAPSQIRSPSAPQVTGAPETARPPPRGSAARRSRPATGSTNMAPADAPAPGAPTPDAGMLRQIGLRRARRRQRHRAATSNTRCLDIMRALSDAGRAGVACVVKAPRMAEAPHADRSGARLGVAPPARAAGALGLVLVVAPADVDETPHPGERPADYVRRVAAAKCDAVADGGAAAADAPGWPGGRRRHHRHRRRRNPGQARRRGRRAPDAGPRWPGGGTTSPPPTGSAAAAGRWTAR